MAWEDDLAATERALGRGRMDCDVECKSVESVRQDYMGQFILTVRETDLEWQE
jgi:hypothetical protein